MCRHVAVLDNERSFLEPLEISAHVFGLEVHAFTEFEECLAWVRENRDAAVISDLKMPDVDGLQAMKAFREISESKDLHLITGFKTSAEQTIASKRLGIPIHHKADLTDLLEALGKDEIEESEGFEPVGNEKDRMLLSLQGRLEAALFVNRHLTEKIVASLRALPHSSEPHFLGSEPFSAEDLIVDVENLTLRGKAYIEAWSRVMDDLLHVKRK